MKRLFNSIVIVLLVLSFAACSNFKPRKPVSKSTSSNTELSIEKNKELYAAEEAAIEELIKVSGEDFERSSSGFYYRFIKKDSIAGDKPKFGDRVTFAYNVTSLKGEIIYTTDELSPITKSMEQEYGVFTGMREALKLMQTGDEAIFYFPSYMGYGYYGDQNRIGVNVPFKSEVKLIGINKEELRK